MMKQHCAVATEYRSATSGGVVGSSTSSPIPTKPSPRPSAAVAADSTEDLPGLAEAAATLHCPELDEHYALGPPIGRGSYSTVYHAVHRNTGKAFAAKVIRKHPAAQFNPDEAPIHRGCSHAHIAKVKDTFVTDEHCVILTELVAGGELFNRLSAKGSQTFSEADTARYMWQLLDAIRYLHERNIVHRDVKLENVLLDAKDNVKLIDFGFSKQSSAGAERSFTSVCGSPNYLSPEMLKASRPVEPSFPTKRVRYGCEVDLWAAGVVMYVLLFGQYPFYHERTSRWHSNILQGQYPLPSSRYVSDGATKLLSRLLDVSPETRCTASEALQSDWFRAHALAPRTPTPTPTTPRPAAHGGPRSASSSAGSHRDSATSSGAGGGCSNSGPQVSADCFQTPPRETHPCVGPQRRKTPPDYSISGHNSGTGAPPDGPATAAADTVGVFTPPHNPRAVDVAMATHPTP